MDAECLLVHIFWSVNKFQAITLSPAHIPRFPRTEVPVNSRGPVRLPQSISLFPINTAPVQSSSTTAPWLAHLETWD